LPSAANGSIQGQHRHDENVALIGMTRASLTGENDANLSIEFRLNGEPELIWLEKRPCRFGGGRWFAVCPHSGRTAAKLYLPSGGRRFLSRHAYRMGYRSQYEAPAGRATLKQDRLAARLGLDLHCPVKPKWMRWRTYDRAPDRLDDCPHNITNQTDEPETLLF